MNKLYPLPPIFHLCLNNDHLDLRIESDIVYMVLVVFYLHEKKGVDAFCCAFTRKNKCFRF